MQTGHRVSHRSDVWNADCANLSISLHDGVCRNEAPPGQAMPFTELLRCRPALDGGKPKVWRSVATGCIDQLMIVILRMHNSSPTGLRSWCLRHSKRHDRFISVSCYFTIDIHRLHQVVQTGSLFSIKQVKFTHQVCEVFEHHVEIHMQVHLT